MRTIKFRAWDKMLKEMFELPFGKNMFWYEENRVNDLTDYNVMQFTGLLDKNGNEIYEGDIVKQIDGTIRRIIWENGSCWGRTTLVKHLALLIDEEMRDCEIVGNICENPNLLTPSQE